MKNVLFAALMSAMVTTTTWAQTPVAPPAPVPPPVLTVAPPVLAPSVEPGTVFTLVQAAPAAPAAPAPPARVGAQARPAAQAPVAPPAPQTVAMPPAVVAAVNGPRFPNPPRNVRFEIVIAEAGVPKPSTKTVSLTVNDGGGSGSVRNGAASASLNVDVRGVQQFEGGAVRAAINVEYQPYVPEATAASGSIQSSITSMFQDGRRIQILQTADPLSDRRTTIEVTMTVLK